MINSIATFRYIVLFHIESSVKCKKAKRSGKLPQNVLNCKMLAQNHEQTLIHKKVRKSFLLYKKSVEQLWEISIINNALYDSDIH